MALSASPWRASFSLQLIGGGEGSRFPKFATFFFRQQAHPDLNDWVRDVVGSQHRVHQTFAFDAMDGSSTGA
jgi:hypothetical protein